MKLMNNRTIWHNWPTNVSTTNCKLENIASALRNPHCNNTGQCGEKATNITFALKPKMETVCIVHQHRWANNTPRVPTWNSGTNDFQEVQKSIKLGHLTTEQFVEHLVLVVTLATFFPPFGFTRLPKHCVCQFRQTDSAEQLRMPTFMRAEYPHKQKKMCMIQMLRHSCCIRTNIVDLEKRE